MTILLPGGGESPPQLGLRGDVGPHGDVGLLHYGLDMGGWEAAEWAAFGAVGALIVYVVLGMTAIAQIRESRKLRQLQTRPYVIVDFEFRGLSVLLGVKNIGATPASNVSITFDKELQGPKRRGREHTFDLFERPIPLIAPARVIQIPLGQGPEFFAEDANIPLSYTVQALYTDLSGKKEYADPAFVLDLLPYKHAAMVTEPLAQINSSLKSIQTVLKGWNSFDGLKVNATDRHRHSRRLERTDYRYDARRTLRSEGVLGLLRWQAQRWKRRLHD